MRRLVCGKDGNRESQTDRGKCVRLGQLHSKSVYSAQFGIKHNRLLSACHCLWCPIKMEFIDALRANQKCTFFPSAPFSFLAPFLICPLSPAVVIFSAVSMFFLFFSPCGSRSSCQVLGPAHYTPINAAMLAHLQVPLSSLSYQSWWQLYIEMKRFCARHGCGRIM